MDFNKHLKMDFSKCLDPDEVTMLFEQRQRMVVPERPDMIARLNTDIQTFTGIQRFNGDISDCVSFQVRNKTLDVVRVDWTGSVECSEDMGTRIECCSVWIDEHTNTCIHARAEVDLVEFVPEEEDEESKSDMPRMEYVSFRAASQMTAMKKAVKKQDRIWWVVQVRSKKATAEEEKAPNPMPHASLEPHFQDARVVMRDDTTRMFDGRWLAHESKRFLCQLYTSAMADRTIHIMEHAPEAVNAMLDFFTSGRLRTQMTDDELVQMIRLADEYDVLSLARACAGHIRPRLTMDTMAVFLPISSLPGLEGLRQAIHAILSSKNNHSQLLDRILTTDPSFLLPFLPSPPPPPPIAAPITMNTVPTSTHTKKKRKKTE